MGGGEENGSAEPAAVQPSPAFPQGPLGSDHQGFQLCGSQRVPFTSRGVPLRSFRICKFRPQPRAWAMSSRRRLRLRWRPGTQRAVGSTEGGRSQASSRPHLEQKLPLRGLTPTLSHLASLCCLTNRPCCSPPLAFSTGPPI